MRFGLAVIRACDTLPQKRSAWIIENQLIRAATSIGANFAEAKSSSSRLEFKKFFEIALKSANETKYWLALLQESGMCAVEVCVSLRKEAGELANMLAAGVIKLKSKL